MALSFKLSWTGDHVLVSLDGLLTEAARDFLFALRAEVMAAERLTFDMAKLSQINSVGVGHWTQFLKALPASTIEFKGCSSTFMDYVCMIPAMTRGGRVASFHASIYCAECGSESSPLVEVPTKGLPDVPSCPRCGGPGLPLGSAEELLQSSHC